MRFAPRGDEKNIVNFTITSFFIVPSGNSGGGKSLSFERTLLTLQAGDGITGSFGIGGPLPSEPANVTMGEMSLFYETNVGPEFVELATNGQQLAVVPAGTVGTIVPFGFGNGATIPPWPLDLGVTPDDAYFGGNSAYVVRVSLTINNPDRAAPPPLISEKAKKALEIASEQLDTLSRGFDMMNAANPAAAGLKTANWAASSAANRLSPQIGLANSVQQTVLAIEDTAVAAIEGNPVAAVLGGVSSIYGLASVVTAALALDPADGDYASVFQPTNHPFTITGATATGNALLTDSIGFLDATLSMLVASERYQGASLAGDSASATLQTNAYNAAETASFTAAAAIATDLTAFQKELVSDGYADENYANGSLAAVQSELAIAGTSDPFLTKLINETQFLLGGTTAAQTLAQQIIGDINAETVAPLSGTVFGGIGTAGDELAAYANGTLLCFLKGTLIRASQGEVPVECLAPGDRIAVAGDEYAPATWIGRRRVVASRHPDPRAVWPIRVTAGAFGEGQPYRDLFLSPDHAVFVMGVLVPIRHLIDGGSIAPEPRDEAVYYHVELPRHDVIFANGLAVESYLETGDREGFDNNDSVARLPPGRPETIWETAGRAPLVVTGHELASARAFLASRAARREPVLSRAA